MIYLATLKEILSWKKKRANTISTYLFFLGSQLASSVLCLFGGVGITNEPRGIADLFECEEVDALPDIEVENSGTPTKARGFTATRSGLAALTTFCVAMRS